MSESSSIMSGDLNSLKRMNRLHIMNLLRSKGPLSRTQLAYLSGLNNKTITNIINDLLMNELVVSVGLQKSDTGRKKEHFKLNNRLIYSIGIDIGASHITVILIDLEGHIIHDKVFNFRYGLRGSIILEKLITLTSQLIEESTIDLDRIIGIGFSAPGFFSTDHGVWDIAFNIPDWKAVPIVDILAKRYDTAVYLQDCSRSMALAELWYGQGKEVDDFILLDLGQGIGLGIVINSVLFEGAGMKSGEIGHLMVDPEGRKCTCGKRGCLESVSSGMAITRIMQERLRQGMASKVSELIHGRIDDLTVIDIVEAADMNDLASIEVLRNAGEKLGRAISYIINLFNPELIILGGQLTKAGTHLIKPLFRAAEEHSIPNLFSDVSIRLSELGPYSASLGAATMAINDKVFSI
jgi:predicted NBD/HSP70 family sugar kinase/predicted transcriptional regulator